MTAFELIRVVDSNLACSWAAGLTKPIHHSAGRTTVADLGFPVAQCIRLVAPLCESTCHRRLLRLSYVQQRRVTTSDFYGN
jgi:hypothetical protein